MRTSDELTTTLFVFERSHSLVASRIGDRQRFVRIRLLWSIWWLLWLTALVIVAVRPSLPGTVRWPLIGLIVVFTPNRLCLTYSEYLRLRRRSGAKAEPPNEPRDV
jgi:hypothetical protein